MYDTYAQAAGCAPVVDAYEAGADRHEPVPDDEVDTACNGIAIPDPGASPLILDAIRESEGGAVATTDRGSSTPRSKSLGRRGWRSARPARPASRGRSRWRSRGEFGPDDTVVLLNTGAGNKDVDALRAHLGEREVEAEATNDGGAP